MDRIIALVERPTEDLRNEFKEQAKKLDQQGSQLATQHKIISEYIARHKPKLAQVVTASMKYKRERHHSHHRQTRENNMGLGFTSFKQCRKRERSYHNRWCHQLLHRSNPKFKTLNHNLGHTCCSLLSASIFKFFRHR